MLLEYIVVRGDSVYKIAMRYGVPPCLIMRLNNLPPDAMIYEGQTLLIPIGQWQAEWMDMLCRQQGIPSPVRRMTPELESSLSGTAPTCEQAQSQASVSASAQAVQGTKVNKPVSQDEKEVLGQYERHIVKTGDTLFGIAKMHGTTIGNILAMNPQITNPNDIKVGMILTVPLPPEDAVVYIVRPGDTLFRIAQRFGTTVEMLATYNYLSSNYTIYPGQQLLIVQ